MSTTATKVATSAYEQGEPPPELDSDAAATSAFAEPEPGYDVASWPTALRDSAARSKAVAAALLRDCAAAATARAQLAHGDYSHGRTFWVPAGCRRSPDGGKNGKGDSEITPPQPQTTLEKLALGIFQAHLDLLLLRQQEEAGRGGAPAEIDLSQSGAEWWTLYVDGEDGGVGWHWDKDYHAELEEGRNVHPYLGTVSYLSDAGAPTVVLAQRTAGPDVAPEDYVGGSNYGSGGRRPVTRAYVSKVVPGKHLAFDGRLLHAAPTDLFDRIKEEMRSRSPKSGGGDNSQRSRNRKGPNGSSKRPKRATLLVNVWINHKPHDADPIDADLRSRLSNLKVGFDLSSNERPEPAALAKAAAKSPCCCVPPFAIDILRSGNRGDDKGNAVQKSNSKRCSNKSKGKGSFQSGKVGGGSAAAEADTEAFEWDLNGEHRLVAKFPVRTLADCWNDGDTFAVHWGKGTSRPYVD